MSDLSNSPHWKLGASIFANVVAGIILAFLVPSEWRQHRQIEELKEDNQALERKIKETIQQAHDDLQSSLQKSARRTAELKQEKEDEIARLAEKTRIEINHIHEDCNSELNARDKQIADLAAITNSLTSDVLNLRREATTLHHPSVDVKFTTDPKTLLQQLDTIDSIVKRGQGINIGQIDQIESVIMQLSMLKVMFEGALVHFIPFEADLTNQLGLKKLPPEKRFGFWTAMFSADYKEKLREYYQFIGEHTAVDRVRTSFLKALDQVRTDMNNIGNEFPRLVALLEKAKAERRYDPNELELAIKALRIPLNSLGVTVRISDPATIDLPELNIKKLD